MSNDQALYVGSVTHSWTTNTASSVLTFPSIPQFQFNAVRLEAIQVFQNGFNTVPSTGPFFLVVKEIIPYVNDFINGIKVPIIGGIMWNLGGTLSFGINLRPLKLTSLHLDKLRSNTLTFVILDGDGNEVVFAPNPNVCHNSATISFWQMQHVISTL
jgi:hypothetical protein